MLSDEEAEFGLVIPFWIDTDAYNDRDRLMFVCGVEFQMLYRQLKSDPNPAFRTIHTENSSRVRMMCGKLGRQCEIESTDFEEWVAAAIGSAGNHPAPDRE